MHSLTKSRPRPLHHNYEVIDSSSSTPMCGVVYMYVSMSVVEPLNTGNPPINRTLSVGPEVSAFSCSTACNFSMHTQPHCSVCSLPSSGWHCTECSNSLGTSGHSSRSQSGTW